MFLAFMVEINLSKKLYVKIVLSNIYFLINKFLINKKIIIIGKSGFILLLTTHSENHFKTKNNW